MPSVKGRRTATQVQVRSPDEVLRGQCAGRVPTKRRVVAFTNVRKPSWPHARCCCSLSRISLSCPTGIASSGHRGSWRLERWHRPGSAVTVVAYGNDAPGTGPRFARPSGPDPIQQAAEHLRRPGRAGVVRDALIPFPRQLELTGSLLA